MKFKTTKKEICSNYGGYYYRFCIGYCDMQYLLNYINPVAYTSGQYGWNSDIYDMQDITGYNCCIVTGYRPFGNIRIDYEVLKQYESNAEKIVHDYKRDINKRKNELKNLLQELLVKYIEKDMEKRYLEKGVKKNG